MVGQTTWDGLPIATDRPYGVSVVVYRRSPDRLLLLHRHHHGPAYDGDWAWTTPAGSRLPGEAVEDCARRELAEEAGLCGVPLTPIDAGTDEWWYFACKVTSDVEVRLVDVEHDRFEWLPVTDALARILPDFVADSVAAACDRLGLNRLPETA